MQIKKSLQKQPEQQSQQQPQYFTYGEDELSHLTQADDKLASVIDKLGIINRQVRPDLFTALVRTIIGQQISVKAQATIWQRLQEFTPITPDNLATLDSGSLQQLGLSFRKVDYIQDIAKKIVSKQLNLDSLSSMTDEQVIQYLCELRGIGVWSAEMLMIFSLQRPNILSFGDLAIHRGLRMLYGHKEISKELFAQYQERFAPYNSVASLYIWAVAGGAIPELQDMAETTIQKNKTEKPEKKATNKTKLKKMQADTQPTNIFIDFYASPLGILEIHATSKHVCYVQFVQTKDSEAKPNHITDMLKKQLQEYFAGQRTHFDVPMQQQGTEFQQTVWQALCTIEYGTTASYKEIATSVGNEKASRAVGMANNKNKIAILVPCHRVISSSGKLVGYAGGLDTKQKLLELEKSLAI